MKSAEAKRDAGRSLPRLWAAPQRRGAELEFLPAALEILETPASPIGRAIAGTLILFFTIAVGWATFGYVDIIATAPGKIHPTGKVKVVQPVEAGVVAAIHVRDGDHVTAGQVLVQIDRTITTAERNRVGHDLLRARLDVARLSALRAGLEAGTGPVGFAPPPDAPAYEVARTQAAMLAQASEQAAKLKSLEHQIAQKTAEAEENAAAIAKLQAGLPLVGDLAEVRRKAFAVEFGNKVAHLEAQLRLSDQQHDLIVAQRRANELAAARQALEWQADQTRAEYEHKLLTDLADAEQKVAELTEDAVKADRKMEEQLLRAPIDGTVQLLAVHTLGGVVTPAQRLMVIVPKKSRLEVEAMVSNRDIGFVQAGQSAEIKIDTFDFTRYGLLQGKVLNVSQDAIVRDKPAAPDKTPPSTPTSGALATTSEPQGQELVYAARVSLDRTQMQVEDKLVNLTPGMAVTVEIKTNQRRLIEFLLSPLLRYKRESLRER
jgi:hemolysin D